MSCAILDEDLQDLNGPDGPAVGVSGRWKTMLLQILQFVALPLRCELLSGRVKDSLTKEGLTAP